MLFFLFCLLLASTSGNAYQKIDKIIVFKSKRKMETYAKDRLLKSYSIALGFSPLGSKEKEGDGKTPEGVYSITFKNNKSQFHKSLRVSYPSSEDKKRALKKGVSPGGDIMIHGLPNGRGWIGKAHLLSDWTLGCVAVTSAEIDEIFAQVSVGIPVIIKP